MNLNQVTIPSKDVKKAIGFYQKLGLELIVHTHDHYARFLCPTGDATFSIHYREQLNTEGGAIIYFEVPDVAKKVKQLKEKGITFMTETTAQSWAWTEAKLKDLDGNTLIIYHAGENRKNPPWRIQ
ncbi:VOC family protein [Patiriisocius hiemis]|uniref:VOC family protein n=1 Tax=Patiriisocius hiemis TaxID=3075604 RepID=A0ABU2YCD7_9FLAO|nr:VOC family protein [Constantimarinum sp. W242]MDT0555672.1 VOC family protein [Constantimarinum sp. W242]